MVNQHDPRRVQVAQRAKDYWDREQHRYPWQAQEDQRAGRVAFNTRADHNRMNTYGNFLRCPWPEMGIVMWGFETEGARDRFLADFPEITSAPKGTGQ